MIINRPWKRYWCGLFHRADKFVQGRFRSYFASPGQDFLVEWHGWRCKVCGSQTTVYIPRFDVK